jgi:4-hydroxybenzoate polyprenyltransferase
MILSGKLLEDGRIMDFKTFGRLILIEQTFFALPFAYLGILFAGRATLIIWIWVTIALAAARTAGMSFNRIIDVNIDAKNPRTKDRLLPQGKVSKLSVLIIAIVSSLVLIGSSFMLNRLCFYLSFAAVILLFTYSYFKRFSSSSHFYLGFVEAAAPVGGYFAVTGAFNVLPFILGIVIMTWIAGLDIVYALQDIDFDKSQKLHSLPSSIGRNSALVISACCYVLSIAGLALAGILAGRYVPYWIAVVCTAIIFIYQQKLAHSCDVSKAIKIFFKANMFISPILLIGTFLDVYFF